MDQLKTALPVHTVHLMKKKLKRIESKIAREAAFKAQNTSKTQNTPIQTC